MRCPHKFDLQTEKKVKHKSLELHVYFTNFRVSVEFLHWKFFGEAYSSHHLYTPRGNTISYLRERDWQVRADQVTQSAGSLTSDVKYLAMAASLMNGSPLSFNLAVLYTSRLAASMSVASWARWCCIACVSTPHKQGQDITPYIQRVCLY